MTGIPITVEIEIPMEAWLDALAAYLEVDALELSQGLREIAEKKGRDL